MRERLGNHADAVIGNFPLQMVTEAHQRASAAAAATQQATAVQNKGHVSANAPAAGACPVTQTNTANGLGGVPSGECCSGSAVDSEAAELAALAAKYAPPAAAEAGTKKAQLGPVVAVVEQSQLCNLCKCASGSCGSYANVHALNSLPACKNNP